MSVVAKRQESPSKKTSWKRVKKRSKPRRMNGTARAAIASVASAPARSPPGHRGPQARPGEHERKHDERHEDHELHAQQGAEDRPNVVHVRQLALVERGRPVGQGRPFEERDPRRARLDRAQPDQGERLALVVVETVAIRREAVPRELVPDERVGREHAQRVHHECRRHDESDDDGEDERRCPHTARVVPRYSPNRRPISRHVVSASNTNAAASRTKTTQKRAPARFVRRVCSTLARRRAR